MKKSFTLLSLILTLMCIKVMAQTPANFVPDQLLVKIKNEVALAPQGISKNISINKELTSIKNSLQAFSIKAIDRPYISAKNYPALQNVYLIKLNKAEQLDVMFEKLKQDANVEYVERVGIIKPSEHIPNDYSVTGTLSHLNRISAPNAWEITKGNPVVKIAIIDQGIDYNHPDLAANIDLANGYDVIDNDSNPINNTPTERHGTHVAGIAGAVTNNGIGVSSLAYNVKIIPVRALNESGGNAGTSAAGIIWAANHGAHIINMSYGGHYGGSTTEENAVQYAYSLGCTLVAAAGNENTNDPSYPAAYTNVIAVAATSSSDVRSSYSNYGTWVDISSPGNSILSTVPGGGYAYFSGTSMASPLVASLCALLKSTNMSANGAAIEYGIKTPSDNIDYRNPSYVGQLGAGRINAFSSLFWGGPCAKDLGSYNGADFDRFTGLTINGNSFSSSSGAALDGKYTWFANWNSTSFSIGSNTFQTNFVATGTPIMAMWIDFNSNGIFEGATEKLYEGSPPTTPTPFQVPCTVTTGTYRLRIRITEGVPNLDPCAFYTYGETEDYVANIISTSTPIISSTASSICAGQSVTLTASGCNGNLLWSNSSASSTINVSPSTTMSYTATCSLAGCGGSPTTATPIAINVTPSVSVPSISYSGTTSLCPNQRIIINATSCNGTLNWSNGQTINAIEVTTTGTYYASCTNVCGTGNSNTSAIGVLIVKDGTIPLSLSGTLPTFTSEGYYQYAPISSTQKMPANTANTYLSAKKVELSPGFKADAQSLFTAKIVNNCSTSEGLVLDVPFFNNANDFSGNNRNGDVNAATLTTGRKGNPNSAYSFNGTNNSISFGSWFNLQEFSVSFWVNAGSTQANAYAMLIDNNHTGSRSWLAQQSNTTNNNYDFATIGSTSGGAVNFNLTPNTWTHLVFVKGNGFVKVYKNNVLVNTAAHSGNIPYDGSQNLILGAWWSSANFNRFWNGKMDDLKIYNRVLSISEVNSLFNE